MVARVRLTPIQPMMLANLTTLQAHDTIGIEKSRRIIKEGVIVAEVAIEGIGRVSLHRTNATFSVPRYAFPLEQVYNGGYVSVDWFYLQSALSLRDFCSVSASNGGGLCSPAGCWATLVCIWPTFICP